MVSIRLTILESGCGRVHVWCVLLITCGDESYSMVINDARDFFILLVASLLAGSLPIRETDLVDVFTNTGCISIIVGE